LDQIGSLLKQQKIGGGTSYYPNPNLRNVILNLLLKKSNSLVSWPFYRVPVPMLMHQNSALPSALVKIPGLFRF
jgi:hypothetical protein